MPIKTRTNKKRRVRPRLRKTRQLLIDEDDISIVELISENSRMSLKDISNKCELSEATCQRRLKRLLSNNLVRCTVSVEPADFGLHVTDFVAVKLKSNEKSNRDKFEEFVCKQDEIVQCYPVIGGEADYLLHIVTENPRTLDVLIRTKLSENMAVEYMSSYFVLNQTKPGFKIPLRMARNRLASMAKSTV